MIKQDMHIIRGMQKDLSVSKASNEFAFDAHNIRITSRDYNTLLSVTNEKGNVDMPLIISGNNVIPNKITVDSQGIHSQYPLNSDVTVSIKYTSLETGSVNNSSYIIKKGYTFEPVSFKYYNIDKITISSVYIDDKYIYYTDDDKAQLEYNKTNVIPGNYLGYATINNYLILFTHSSEYDYIHRFTINKDNVIWKILFRGNLNFSDNNPIETLSQYETEEIQKVYWVDGINQCRLINIAANEDKVNKWNDKSFDFVQSLNLKENITVSKNNSQLGIFSPGTIQYAFTYYNMYGQESNVFYTSPLQYISYIDRGASPDDKLSNSFDIHLNNLDLNFDFVRIYSIHRTSLDAVPVVVKVADLKIEDTEIYYNDNNSTGELVDSSYLLYVGGQGVIPSTMAAKDNTLFFGNVRLMDELLEIDTKSLNVEYEHRILTKNKIPSAYYSYESNLNDNYIKTFKSREWYRFGIQFQFNNGRWSEPIFICDKYNSNIKPEMNIGEDLEIKVVKAKSILSKEFINSVLEKYPNIVKARGVVVYPNITDREVLAQGILCPTVYNVGNRFGNAPFAQSSWFSRPNNPFDYESQKDNFKNIGYDDYIGRNSPGGMYSDAVHTFSIQDDPNVPIFGVKFDLSNTGSWAEFRHNKPLPDNWKKNAEIQCIANIPEALPFTNSSSNSDLINEVYNNQEYYYVDQSILTMHSPEVEFDTTIQNIDTSNLKMRIVGVIPITSNISDIDIQTSTPTINPKSIGLYKETIGNNNLSYHGYKSLISGAFWIDSLVKTNGDFIGSKNTEDASDEKYQRAFMIYPWHRNGSLNNEGVLDTTTDKVSRSSYLKNKKMSNLKYSAFTKYFNTPWLAETYDTLHNGITEVQVFNSDTDMLIKIPEPKNSNIGTLNYYGNVDQVVTSSRFDFEYSTTPLYSASNSDDVIYATLNKDNGYPIIETQPSVDKENNNMHNYFSNLGAVVNSLSEDVTMYGTDPISIKYKSTPHLVFAMNYTNDGRQVILPGNRFKDYSGDVLRSNDENILKSKPFFWNRDLKENVVTSDGVYQDIIPEFISDLLNSDKGFAYNYGYLYLAELYNDNVINRFGGTSYEAFENNRWIPAGEPVSITKDKSETIEFIDGDTFFQRYDCLKTYPYTLDDTNSIVEIVSFMCETRVNIDGRYDRNRGQNSNLVMNPSIFNLINPVYSQKNTFFSYRGINPERFKISYFPNTITWTKEKQASSLVDSWTNITLASTLELDGSKGNIVSLNTFNNEIYCFQDNGISNILYNSRVMIPTSDGTPIEISNGLKVDGKKYISDIGCNNKWSIAESPSGIYFIDSTTKGIYLFNGQLSCLTEKLGMSSWIGNYKYDNSWIPSKFNNFVSFYDKTNGDVYFVNKYECLCYSEGLGQFTSFMDYNEVPAMFNINDKFYSLKHNKLWEQFAGDYNMFYGEYKPFSITIISNQDEPNDKIFDNIEFRSDSWDKNNNLLDFDTFDTLNVWNEYQNGELALYINSNKPSTLKKKYRVWRANIPRDISNNRDRIRNTWAYIKLTKNTTNKNRTELHDLVVKYFV